jgi:hypothetical protein
LVSHGVEKEQKKIEMKAIEEGALVVKRCPISEKSQSHGAVVRVIDRGYNQRRKWRAGKIGHPRKPSTTG